MKQAVLISTMIICGLAAIAACQRGPENIDISGFHTFVSTDETESSENAENSNTIVIDAEPVTSVSNLTCLMDTYKTNKISIQYPKISGLTDPDQEQKVNEILKLNALSIIRTNSLDEENDTVSIECEIISSDRRQLIAVYTGTIKATKAAYPTNVFYTNTLDTEKVENIGFSRYADSQSMAAYVLSSDCELVNVTSENGTSEMERDIRTYLAGQKQNYYTSLFRSADFPVLTSGQNEISKFPESFSFSKLGTIYFSIPVPHALGDYVIVKFTPETK